MRFKIFILLFIVNSVGCAVNDCYKKNISEGLLEYVLSVGDRMALPEGSERQLRELKREREVNRYMRCVRDE